MHTIHRRLMAARAAGKSSGHTLSLSFRAQRGISPCEGRNGNGHGEIPRLASLARNDRLFRVPGIPVIARMTVRAAGAARCVLMAGLLLAFGAGCSQPPRGDGTLRVWPEAPNPPRIILRRIVTGLADYQRQDPLAALGRLIAGEAKQTLLRPQAVAVDGDQRLYVADQEHQGVHVFNMKDGGGRFFAKAGEDFLTSPTGLAWCDGLLAVSDSLLNQVFLLRPDGKLERTITRPGGFKRPTGLAYDASRQLLYVVDTLAGDVCVFKRSGEFLRAFGRPGREDGAFNFPTYLAVDANGTIWVTDSLNFRVQAFDTQGKFLKKIGELGDATGFMAVPKGIGVDAQGRVYVVDSSLSTVQIFDQEGRFLLSFGERGDGPGSFQVPTGLAVSPGGRIYVCDSYSRRLQIFQVMEPTDENKISH
jgi:sugar lactone lactonase YvrE